MSDWVEIVDSSSGNVYYSNSVTLETSWDKPDDFDGDAEAENVGGGDWTENYDEDSGMYFYSHNVTGETTWDKPEAFVSPSEAEGGVVEQEAASESAAVDILNDPANWQTLIDESSGNPYYMNEMTEPATTQWDMPMCLQTPAAESVVDVVEDEGDVVASVEIVETPEDVSVVDESVSSSPPPEPTAKELINRARARTQSYIKTSTSARGSKLSVEASGDASTPGSLSNRNSILRTSILKRTSSSGSILAVGDKKLSILSTTSSHHSSLGSMLPEEIVAPPSPPPPAINFVDEAPALTRKLLDLEESSTLAAHTLTDGTKLKKSLEDEEYYKLVKEYQLSVYCESLVHFPSAGNAANGGGIAAAAGANRSDNAPQHDNTICWQSDMLKAPLLSSLVVQSTDDPVVNTQKQQLAREAIRLFRCVTAFMGDRKTIHGRDVCSLQCVQILEIMMEISDQSLRDEVYCQICKQTTNNPSIESTIKGWQLFLICISSFPPSDVLTPFLVCYCCEHIHDFNVEISKISSLLISNILKSIRLSGGLGEDGGQCRKELPSTLELRGLEQVGIGGMDSSIVIRVYFVDGKYVMCRIDSWTTAQDMARHIASKLGIALTDDILSVFGLYEILAVDVRRKVHDSSGDGTDDHHKDDTDALESGVVEQRILSGNERLLDVMSVWQQYYEEDALAENESPSQQPCLFYQFQFKVKYFFDMPPPDAVSAIELIYQQVIGDLKSAYYPMSEREALLLSAMQLQHDLMGEELPFKSLGTGTGSGGLGSTISTGHHHLTTKKSLSGSAANLRMGEEHFPNAAIKRTNKLTDVAMLSKYMPTELLSEESMPVDRFPGVLRDISAMYASFKRVNALDIRWLLLSYVWSWRIFGATYFTVVPQRANVNKDGHTHHNPTHSDTTVVMNINGVMVSCSTEIAMAISMKGIVFISVLTKDFLAELTYGDIVSWGVSSNSLVVVTGATSARHYKLYFKASQAKEMNELLIVYAAANKKLSVAKK